jgi:acyl-CoA thioesterase
MEDIKAYFAEDALARHLGIELVEVSPGRALARMPVRPDHYNSWKTVHGGAIFALADFAFAAAANSHGELAVALSASISFLRAATSGVLTAEGKEVSRSRRIGNYLITVTDEAGQNVALFQGTVYRKGDPIPPTA